MMRASFGAQSQKVRPNARREYRLGSGQIVEKTRGIAPSETPRNRVEKLSLDQVNYSPVLLAVNSARSEVARVLRELFATVYLLFVV
jgi:hypothetical protein